MYFDGNCLNNFDECTPDCPVGILDFGEIEVDGKSIIEHLKIRKNFSYWWMTLLVEKCNMLKSTQIDNIIKLLALELWLKDKKYQKTHFLVLMPWGSGVGKKAFKMNLALVSESLVKNGGY